MQENENEQPAGESERTSVLRRRRARQNAAISAAYVVLIFGIAGTIIWALGDYVHDRSTAPPPDDYCQSCADYYGIWWHDENTTVNISIDNLSGWGYYDKDSGQWRLRGSLDLQYDGNNTTYATLKASIDGNGLQSGKVHNLTVNVFSEQEPRHLIASFFLGDFTVRAGGRLNVQRTVEISV